MSDTINTEVKPFSLRLLLDAALDPERNEGTAYPWWFIIDPRAIVGRPMSVREAIGSVAMTGITGPFFSRESAEAFLKATHYNFGKHAIVWCGSGTYSKDYKALLGLARAEALLPVPAAEEAPSAQEVFISVFRAIQAAVHANAHDKGWHKEERNEGELIALEHGELSECLEALRHGNPPSEHIPAFTGAEEELADVIIRIMDHASSKGHRVAEAIIAKMAFNATRPYRHGDKRF